MSRSFVFALLACLPLVALARADDTEKESKKLEGTWQLKDAELAGQKLPAESVKSFRLTLTGGKYTLKSDEQPDAGTYKLDTGKKPRQMTITGTEGPNKGKTLLAIYELDDDTLKVCYDLSGQAHPEEFKTKAGTKLFLATYKREK
jgi:uncharacterized protein (TIGR03067 family)